MVFIVGFFNWFNWVLDIIKNGYGNVLGKLVNLWVWVIGVFVLLFGAIVWLYVIVFIVFLLEED